MNQLFSTPHARPALLLLAAALCLVASAAGCNYGRGGDNIDRVEPGMGFQAVTDLMGEPHEVVRGSGLNLGYEEWHYPEGVVFFNRLEVVRAVRDPQALERVRERKTSLRQNGAPEDLYIQE